MKKTNCFLAVLFILTGCFVSCGSSDDNDIFIEEPKEYKLVSVMWKLDEESGDKVETVTEKLEERVVYNYEDTPKLVEHRSDDDINQTSGFECEEEDLEFINKWLDKNIEVSIPVYPDILSSTFAYLTGTTKAPLDFEKEHGVEMSLHLIETVKLPPKMKITYNTTVRYKKITATISMQYAAEGDPHNIVRIGGKWTGMIHDYSEPRVVVSYID